MNEIVIQVYIFWGIVFFFLISIFILGKFAIKKYFDSKKGRYDLNSNYISALAISSLFGGLLVVLPSTRNLIINLIDDQISC